MRAVSLTNRGGRDNNEDYICHTQSNGVWCFVLCDGLGGQLCGEVASGIVATAVCEAFDKNPEISAEALEAYMKQAAWKLEQERDKDKEKYNMSSTVTVLVTDGKNAVWGHIGDSRLYHIRNDEILYVTDDHSVAFMEFESGMIDYHDIRFSPHQNKLLRCVSDTDNFYPDISEVVELKKGDAFLLCSDGFWEYVYEEDIEAAVKSACSPKEWLEEMLKTLHKNEIERNDNYSVIAIMV